MQRKTVLGVAAGVLVLGVSVVGCGDDGDKAADGKRKSGADAGASATPGKADTAPAKSPEVPDDVPSPDPGQTADLVKRLGEIHPALVAQQDKAVSRARNVCNDARWSEEGDAGVNARAAARFSGGDVPTLTPEQGGRIVTAVRESFCS
ncbi:hypothetical protein [Streptomyces sp. SAJ15]|uniref:hypothetical protein n=1 Tax=Streptomyces sp. SAJ15 TaxID=2011095 RepID=UPI001186D617|nr:hypothetical protein [Streptomyces sp. SAJ15]TVL93297.1 hypothetical protein CD790_09330 [Streptomyces sp. SAJ15]